MRKWGLLVVLAGCSAPQSGVLVVTSWPSSLTVQSLKITTTLGSDPSRDNTEAGPLASPYRVLVESPSGWPIKVDLTAVDSNMVAATGEVIVQPKDEVVTSFVDLMVKP
jgi:hypothetical protein